MAASAPLHQKPLTSSGSQPGREEVRSCARRQSERQPQDSERQTAFSLSLPGDYGETKCSYPSAIAAVASFELQTKGAAQ